MVILVLVGFAAASAYSTYKNLYALTSDAPLPVPMSDGGSYPAVKSKIDAFTAAVKEGKSASLKLSADDLNAMVAAAPGLSEARHRLYFSIRDNRLVAQVSIPLDSVRAMKGRWLNGTILFEPKMENGHLILLPKSIESGNVGASLGTVWALQQIAWSTSFITDPETSQLLTHVRALRIENHELVLE